MSKLLNILESIPEVKKDDLVKNKLLIEDIEKMHPSLTLDNPLTYFIYLDREKNLSIEDRNVIFKIIAKLKQNNITLHQTMIEKHNMESHKPLEEEEDCVEVYDDHDDTLLDECLNEVLDELVQ